MKLAAVDIGSNAIRLQISTVLDHSPKLAFKKIEYVRFPLRLGHDVFTENRISPKSIEKFRKLMRIFKMLIDLYECDDYMFCATSAMRESENGKEIAEIIKNDLNVSIQIIDGAEEGELINKAIWSYLSDESYLHIDVGGGSTELNLYVKGKKIKTRSFKIGAVRMLEHNDSPLMWKDMEKWIKENVKHEYGKLTGVGTGGNISKIYELGGLKPGKLMSLRSVKRIQKLIKSRTIEERIYELQMNPDRADVIEPASDIYIKVMNWARAKNILVPDVGLKDGILLHLYQRNKAQQKIEFR